MVQALIASMSKPQLHLHEFLQEVARTIYHHLHIREVTIGVRSAGDGLFRYEAMYGLRHEAWSAHKPLAYTEEDFFNPNKWKGTVISRQTRLLLAEDNPYEDKEEQTYDMQLSAKSKRRTPEHSIEGDYLDVLCYGPDDELMGWIETSGTWDGKIPDARTVRYLELIASVVATAVEMSEHRANKG